MKVIAFNGSQRKNGNTAQALKKALEADVLIVGSPIYFHYPSAQTRAFIERLAFPLYTYLIDPNAKSDISLEEFQKKVEAGEITEMNLEVFKTITRTKKFTPTAMIYTMNCPQWLYDKINYPLILSPNEDTLREIFGYSESFYIHDTYQFSDYSKYDVTMFDEKAKRKQREEQFPIDLQNAFNLGKRLTEMAYSANDKNKIV